MSSSRNSIKSCVDTQHVDKGNNKEASNAEEQGWPDDTPPVQAKSDMSMSETSSSTADYTQTGELHLQLAQLMETCILMQ